MDFIEMDGVVPNPRVSRMREGVDLCKREGVDCILGVGGGSVFDSCKGIGIGACSTHDVLDFCGGKTAVERCLPCLLYTSSRGIDVQRQTSQQIRRNDERPQQEIARIDLSLIHI